MDLQARSGVSDSVISDIERGRVGEVKIPTLTRVLHALDAKLVLDVRWRGGELDRLLDADPAQLSERWHAHLRTCGWPNRGEVSFNHYGERGIIDNLAFDPSTRTLVVTEIKSAIYDTQDLLGKLDIKERVAKDVGRRFGWMADRVVVCLVVADGRTNRRRIDEDPAMFSRFDTRGRQVIRWLRAPRVEVAGLLLFAPLADSAGGGRRRAGRQRIRMMGRASSVEGQREQPEQHGPPA